MPDLIERVENMISLLKGRPQFSFARAIELGKLVTITGSSQGFVQAVGLISGILVIRLLPTTEYALYVLANTMLGTMTVLADGGISTGVVARGGNVWKDRDKLGAVIATGLDLRKKFAVVSLFVSIPLMVTLLLNHGADWLTCILIVMAVVPTFITALSGSLLQVAPRLKQDVIPMVRNQLKSNLMRLVLLAGSLVFVPFAFVAVLASGIPQAWANLNLRKISFPYANWRQRPDPEIRKDIMGFVKRMLPASVYYCISGQITIWLISIFGSTMAIAQVGALTRLAMLLGVVNMVLNMLVVPRFARLADTKAVLADFYVKIQAGLIGVCAIAVIAVWLFSEQILWVLGANYSGLAYELLLAFVGSCLNLIVGFSAVLNSSRGWLLHPVTGISFGVLSIVAGVTLIDVSTLRGVLYFNIFTGVAGLFIHPLFGAMKLITKKA